MSVEAADALNGMWVDIVELATFDWVSRSALISFVALPVVSVVLVIKGHRVAWIPLGITAVLVAVWFLYYATDWWGPLSGPAAFWAVVLTLMVGWAVVIRRWITSLRGSHS